MLKHSRYHRVAYSCRTRVYTLAVFCLCCAGCSTVLIKKTETITAERIDPERVREEIAVSLPGRIQTVHTVVFQYKWRSFAALGYTDIRPDTGTFAVSCMTPVGVKLFELTGDRNSIITNFVVPELLAKGDLPKIVGEDLRKIYFDTLPSPEATITATDSRVVFTGRQQEGTLRHVYDIRQKTLQEKSLYEKNRCVWRVIYEDYCRKDEKWFSQKITLKNHRFGYNLIIRVKEAR